MQIRRGSIKKRYFALATVITAAVAVPVVPNLASALPSAAQAAPARLLVPSGQKVAGAPKVVWPSSGRALIEVAGLGAVGSSGSSTESVPIASITKVMTAYTILEDHPLTAGARGPAIRITKADVRAYDRLKAEGASVVKVKAGTRLTQRQALQGLLIASGGNLAETLARWDAGSSAAFIDRMNQNARELGLDSTSFADTYGVAEQSRSSAEDLLDLAQAAMRKPAFRAVVRQTSAKIPVNQLKSTNTLLGKNGVIGIKTGTTYAAGGCLLFAATDKVGGRTHTIYGVVLGARGKKYSANAQKFSKSLVVATRKELRKVTLLKPGRALVSVTKDNGRTYKYGVKSTLTSAGWSGLSYRLALPTGLAPGETPKHVLVRVGSRTIKVPLAPLG